MDFEVEKGVLLEPLQLASGVVERKQTVAVLSNLLVKADERVTFTGTDLEVEVSSSVDGVAVTEPGRVTLPARKLLDICRSLKDDSKLRFKQEENRVVLSSGRFKSHLATLPVVDFPNVELEGEQRSVTLPADQLKRLLSKTSFAMAQQDVRFYFNGMLLELTADRVRAVATNGQRLAMSEIQVPTGGEGRFILPRKGVLEFSRMIQEGAGELELSFTENHARFACGNAVIVSKLIDGTYPDYEQAIPRHGEHVMECDRDELREALSRTAILSNEMYRNVRMSFRSGELMLHANNPMQEEAEDLLAVQYDGAELDIGFNVGYLIDALSAMGGERVRMTLADASTAAVVGDPADELSVYVISPMML